MKKGFYTLGAGCPLESFTTKISTSAGTPTGEALEANEFYRVVSTVDANFAVLSGKYSSMTAGAPYIPADQVEYIRTTGAHSKLGFEPLSGSGDFYATKLIS